MKIHQGKGKWGSNKAHDDHEQGSRRRSKTGKLVLDEITIIPKENETGNEYRF